MKKSILSENRILIKRYNTLLNCDFEKLIDLRFNKFYNEEGRFTEDDFILMQEAVDSRIDEITDSVLDNVRNQSGLKKYTNDITEARELLSYVNKKGDLEKLNYTEQEKIQKKAYEKTYRLCCMWANILAVGSVIPFVNIIALIGSCINLAVKKSAHDKEKSNLDEVAKRTIQMLNDIKNNPKAKLTPYEKERLNKLINKLENHKDKMSADRLNPGPYEESFDLAAYYKEFIY